MKLFNIFLFVVIVLSSSNNTLALMKDDTLANKDSLSDYQILTDSTVQYNFGYACSIAGRPPKGRRAIGRLIRNNDYKTIKLVLDGFNDEGKIYAIEALLTLNSEKKLELTEIEKNKIKSIINSDLSINRCQGCLVSSIGTIKLFREKIYRQLLKKNEVEIINR